MPNTPLTLANVLPLYLPLIVKYNDNARSEKGPEGGVSLAQQFQI